jgi:hypothetical protein
MSPYFNSETGELSEADYSTVADETGELSPAERKPAEPTKPAAPSDAAPLKPSYPVFTSLTQIEDFRTEVARDIYHPARQPDSDLMDYCAQAESRLLGHTDGERVLGEVFAGGQMRAVGDNLPVRIPEFSEAARAVGAEWDTPAHAEHHEALVTKGDQSGLPRYHVEGMFQDVAAAIEEFAGDADADTPEAGTAELVRLEGSGRARSIIADAKQLVTLLEESGDPNFIAAANDLVTLSNHPRVLIGAARLYQELRNLPPKGPWEKLLLDAGAKFAGGQEAAKRRRAPADDPTREVGRFGRP